MVRRSLVFALLCGLLNYLLRLAWHTDSFLADVGALGFILAMIFQLVEDLDNPFLGYWNITPEPFERALRHIEEDY